MIATRPITIPLPAREPFLAVTPAGATSVTGVVLWSAVLVILLVLLAYAVQFLRKWIKAPDDPTAEAGFSIAAMRELHRRGELSDEEFERIKARISAVTRAAADRIKPASGVASGNSASSKPVRLSDGELDAILAIQKHKARQEKNTQASAPGESPPPPAPSGHDAADAPGESPGAAPPP